MTVQAVVTRGGKSVVRRKKLLRLLSILFAFGLIAAACGDSSGDGDSAGGADTSSDDDGGGDGDGDGDDGGDDSVLGGDDGDDGDDSSEPADDGDGDDSSEPADDGDDGDDGDGDGDEPEGGLADESINGNGAALFEAAINNPPGPADESLDPVLFTMANLEGDAAGSFPEIREGLEIAIEQINSELGGIDGRPVELDVCVHGFDPNAAINCANEIAEASPNLNINGIEFFTPALYPTFIGGNVPTIQTVPIFVADFTQPEVISPWGGCPVAFPGAATYTMETLGLAKVAVVYANTPPGLECYSDTEERFWQYLVDNEAAGQEFVGIPDNAGDPSDDDAIAQQVASFFGDTPGEETAVFFGTQASDCNAIMSAVDAAGIDTQVIASGSCIDDSVLSNPAAVGATFGQQGYIAERGDLYDAYTAWELDWRNDLLENSDLRTTPVSAFLRVGHSTGLLAWEVLNRMVADGQDIDDPDAMVAAWQALENQHIVGTPPVTCTDNTEEFPAVCKKTLTFTVWDGSEWSLGDLDGELIDVGDIQARVAAGNPRPDAE